MCCRIRCMVLSRRWTRVGNESSYQFVQLSWRRFWFYCFSGSGSVKSYIRFAIAQIPSSIAYTRKFHASSSSLPSPFLVYYDIYGGDTPPIPISSRILRFLLALLYHSRNPRYQGEHLRSPRPQWLSFASTVELDSYLLTSRPQSFRHTCRVFLRAHLSSQTFCSWVKAIAVPQRPSLYIGLPGSHVCIGIT